SKISDGMIVQQEAGFTRNIIAANSRHCSFRLGANPCSDSHISLETLLPRCQYGPSFILVSVETWFRRCAPKVSRKHLRILFLEDSGLDILLAESEVVAAGISVASSR